MKNIIIIDVDTERDRQILLGKPPEIPSPTTQEGVKVMVNTDITCLIQTLCELIAVSASNSYGDLDVYIETATKALSDIKIEPKKEENAE